MPFNRATILMLILLILPSSLKSNIPTTTFQKTSGNERKIGLRKQRHMLAKEQITQLKEGALLVRLQTKRNSIEALRKKGRVKLAEKIETRQRNYNLEIVAAFKTNFKFCPTYFFYSHYTNEIREKRFDQVIFLTDSLTTDSAIKFNYRNFLTAEFGISEQDTAIYFSHYNYESDGNWSVRRVEKFYCTSNINFGALIIKSDQFIQLKKPFPVYVRTFDTLPIKRSPKRTVKIFNRRLKMFYDWWK